MVLSQPTTQTTASKSWPRHTSSMESAMISRLTSEARMPSVPMVSPSEIAMVLNSMGVPPASRIPSLTLADNRRRWKLHGMVSIQVLATPINGLRRSESLKPIALNMARDGARSRPSVMAWLQCLGSMMRGYNRNHSTYHEGHKVYEGASLRALGYSPSSVSITRLPRLRRLQQLARTPADEE